MDYKNTVFLPKTDFPMKANLAKREQEHLKYWESINLYKKIREQSKNNPPFILHFGPPYANGHIHTGHALSKILKDVVNKIYQMKGYDAPLIPGWDCHGLPIEWKIEESYRKKGQQKETIPLLEFREECRQFANKWVNIQKKEFQRLGIIADWNAPYTTMTFENEAKIVEQLGHFLLNGSLYKGLRPVLWSVVEKTALADAEVEYKDHTCDSIYVAFPVQSSPHPLLTHAMMVIWTTTPWTLPGNRAIAFHPDLTYALIEDSDTNTQYLIASALVEQTTKAIGIDSFRLIDHILGTALKGTVCHHPMAAQGYDFDVPLLPGDHVTADTGSGLVHTAPGHGVEDFILGQKFGLEIPETVGADGCYGAHVPCVAGMHIFKVNPYIIETLKTNRVLLSHRKMIHSYPHSWRSKAPLIYRTTPQWFISMETHQLREKALKAIDSVEWFPAQGKNRIRSMVEHRPDWCISRQRAWGTPLTLFVHKKTGDVLKDAQVHSRIVDVIRQEGGDAWFTSENHRFLKDDYNAEEFEKITDILDVWFDSGCSQEFVRDKFKKKGADLYLEGSDQHRGWFQSSLLESCGVHGHAPYRQVLTHGFVLDEKGYKMSKSQGNVVSPDTIIDHLGADVLRLWVVSSDYSEDMRIGQDILKQQEDIYRRFRNTLRYLLGALDGYHRDEEEIPYDPMPPLEKWILHRLKELNEHLDHALQTYNLTQFYTELHTFCASDLSAFYFDIRKDSLYCDGKKSINRRSARTVMYHIFECLAHWLAPVLSFTAEETWAAFSPQKKESIHLRQFPLLPPQWKDPSLAKDFEKIRKIRSVITGALEKERASKKIGSSLQASVTIHIPPQWEDSLNNVDWAEMGITSAADLVTSPPPPLSFTLDDIADVGVVVILAEGEKCCRCWKVLPEVETNSLCHRCHQEVHS